MITLHHLKTSRSFRILWFLEELKLAYGLDYELVSHQRDTKTFLAPKDLQKIHPLGKAPILIDTALPEGEQALVESAFILEYLVKTYDKEQRFYPKDDKAWRDYTFWLHFAESSLMPFVLMNVVLNKTIAKAPILFQPIAKKIKAGIDEVILNKNISSALNLLEARLAKHDWLAGDISVADIQMHFAVKALEKTHLDLQKHRHTIAWLGRCEKRQAHQNVLRHW